MLNLNVFFLQTKKIFLQVKLVFVFSFVIKKANQVLENIYLFIVEILESCNFKFESQNLKLKG